MTTNGYMRRHNVFNIGYHIIFCPKYRKPYLLRFETLIRKCILKTSIKFQFIVAEIDVMPDHVHLFIKCVSQNPQRHTAATPARRRSRSVTSADAVGGAHPKPEPEPSARATADIQRGKHQYLPMAQQTKKTPP